MRAIAAILGWIAVTPTVPGEADLIISGKARNVQCVSIGKLSFVGVRISADPVCRADFKGKGKVWGRRVHEAVTRQWPPKLESPNFPVTRQNDRAAFTEDITEVSNMTIRDIWLNFAAVQKFAGNLEFASRAVANVPEHYLYSQPRHTRTFVIWMGHKVQVRYDNWLNQFDALNRYPRPPVGRADFVGLNGGVDGLSHFLGLIVRPLSEPFSLPPERAGTPPQHSSEHGNGDISKVHFRKEARYPFPKGLVLLAALILMIGSWEVGGRSNSRVLRFGAAVVGLLTPFVALLALYLAG